MRICVFGLWHLGTVTAACLASKGHRVVGLDLDDDNVERLKAGIPPLYEPGLGDLLKTTLAEGALSFTSDVREAVSNIDALWVAFDTPVDDQDQADVAYVEDRVRAVLPYVKPAAIVLISSQLPVGTTKRLEDSIVTSPRRRFAYSPENLRLGSAINAFLNPSRVIVGVRETEDRELLKPLFASFADRIEWMSVESAEMTKHAINAFLATSVTFINEIATLCEQVGADAKEIERGLKTEPRIGPKAYLSPGAAFAGGTLARDVAFLSELARDLGRPAHLFNAIQQSNAEHREWSYYKLNALLGNLRSRTIAVWGLTYKPGTDTLRRSSSVHLCQMIRDAGGCVRVHDPIVKTLPADLERSTYLATSPLDAATGADALVIATEWPEYNCVDIAAVVDNMRTPIVLDPSRFLTPQFEMDSRVRYFTVGKR